MPCTKEDDVQYIECFNGACASNGGDNASALLAKIESARKTVEVYEAPIYPTPPYVENDTVETSIAK